MSKETHKHKKTHIQVQWTTTLQVIGQSEAQQQRLTQRVRHPTQLVRDAGADVQVFNNLVP